MLLLCPTCSLVHTAHKTSFARRHCGKWASKNNKKATCLLSMKYCSSEYFGTSITEIKHNIPCKSLEFECLFLTSFPSSLQPSTDSSCDDLSSREWGLLFPAQTACDPLLSIRNKEVACGKLSEDLHSFTTSHFFLMRFQCSCN